MVISLLGLNTDQPAKRCEANTFQIFSNFALFDVSMLKVYRPTSAFQLSISFNSRKHGL